MTGRAASETLKRRKAREEIDLKINEAVELYLAQQNLPSNERKSSREIAAQFGVCSYKTILERARGRPSMSEFNAAKQKLTSGQEAVLVDFLLESAARGFGLTHAEIYEEASAIYKASGGDVENDPLGTNWVDRFLERHHGKLQTHWSRELDTQRANTLNPASVSHWYNDIIKPHVVDKAVPPELLFGMDETGFPQSSGARQRVVGARGTKTQHASGSGNRENVTAIVTICADGTALRPTIIYKGKNLLKTWVENNIAKAS